MDLKNLKFAELPEELVTGVKTIDQQHVAIITIINHLSACAQEGQGQKQLENIISFLKAYVDTHFEEEEKYMEKYDYSQIESHKKQHKIFKRFVANLEEKIKTGNYDSTFHIRVIRKLKEWIINHVIKVDTIMATYIKQFTNE
jgi:hemerythrin